MHLLAARQEDLDAGPQAVDLGQTPADLVMLSFSDSDLTALDLAAKAAGTWFSAHLATRPTVASQIERYSS